MIGVAMIMPSSMAAAILLSSTLVILVPVPNEGGGLGLVPRISVLGEVFVLAGLSVALELAHGLTVEEYSRWHRAGAIGEAARRLAETRASRRRA